MPDPAEIHKKCISIMIEVLRKTLKLLRTHFPSIPDQDKAWPDFHRLAQDEDHQVRDRAAFTLRSVFGQVLEKDQAWQDLHKLAYDKSNYVRENVAETLGSVFGQVSDTDQVWQDLLRLTQDEERRVRMYAYHSLGRASVSKATEAHDKDTLKKELEVAVAFFEKSSKESQFGPARFCHLFYRTYYAITFLKDKEDLVQKYLAEAKKAVGGSKSKAELLKAVENLAEALRRAQHLKTRSVEELTSELNTYTWYCDKAADHMTAAEDKAPGAVKLMRKCNPLIEERIQFAINEIQDIARQICQVTTGRGPGAEAFCGRIKDAARSLSVADVTEILKSISDFDSILREKCVLLPEGERNLVKSKLDGVSCTETIPEKLDGIKVVVNFYLSRIQKDDEFLRKLGEIHDDIKALRQSLLNQFKLSERNILYAIFDRLDKDKLEIVRCLLNAMEKDKIPRKLIDETLEATKDLISEIRSNQNKINDPDIALWDAAINSPELNVENRLKVSIPIIPLLLTYEGSYNFQSRLKLDKTWNKLCTLAINARRSFK